MQIIWNNQSEQVASYNVDWSAKLRLLYSDKYIKSSYSNTLKSNLYIFSAFLHQPLWLDKPVISPFFLCGIPLIVHPDDDFTRPFFNKGLFFIFLNNQRSCLEANQISHLWLKPISSDSRAQVPKGQKCRSVSSSVENSLLPLRWFPFSPLGRRAGRQCQGRWALLCQLAHRTSRQPQRLHNNDIIAWQHSAHFGC